MYSAISDLVRKQLGDLTFQEAYERTRRVLNVIIPFESRRPVLMNFLTTPNVVRSPVSSIVDESLFGLLLWQVIRKEVFLVSGET